jgi:hypothetical protein
MPRRLAVLIWNSLDLQMEPTITAQRTPNRGDDPSFSESKPYCSPDRENIADAKEALQKPFPSDRDTISSEVG